MTNETQYKGWNGVLDGKSHVRVINVGYKDGKRLLKVRVGKYMGVDGWSGYDKPIYTYPNPPIWVFDHRVETRAQIAKRTGEPMD